MSRLVNPISKGLFMAYDNTLTVIGNVVRDPELQFLGSGVALVKFSIADIIMRRKHSTTQCAIARHIT